MKLAAITITYNDDYKFNEWCENFSSYKDVIYKSIIVDNGSEKEYLNKVKESFPNSFIIERSSNGGCTAAYNDGIKFALQDEQVDTILLVGNDILISADSLKLMYLTLKNHDDIGMVGSLMFKKDSNEIIEDFGCSIDSNLYLKVHSTGKCFDLTLPDIKIVDTVPGGLNMSTRSFYEKVGFQDEKLFMYSDEVDMGLRAIKSGFKMAVLRDAKSWHQHINPNGRNIRLPYSAYLIGRNKIYLAYKHFGFIKVLKVFLYQLFCFAKLFIASFKHLSFTYSKWFLIGVFSGIFRTNRFDKYILK